MTDQTYNKLCGLGWIYRGENIWKNPKTDEVLSTEKVLENLELQYKRLFNAGWLPVNCDRTRWVSPDNCICYDFDEAYEIAKRRRFSKLWGASPIQQVKCTFPGGPKATLYYYNKRIYIDFPYDKDIIAEVRKIIGRKYHGPIGKCIDSCPSEIFKLTQTQKVWSIPDSFQSHNRLADMGCIPIEEKQPAQEKHPVQEAKDMCRQFENHLIDLNLFKQENPGCWNFQSEHYLRYIETRIRGLKKIQ